MLGDTMLTLLHRSNMFESLGHAVTRSGIPPRVPEPEPTPPRDPEPEPGSAPDVFPPLDPEPKPDAFPPTSPEPEPMPV
jgi:hypothetical protein